MAAGFGAHSESAGLLQKGQAIYETRPDQTLALVWAQQDRPLGLPLINTENSQHCPFKMPVCCVVIYIRIE